MPFWIHNRWRDPAVRDVVEQCWTELPEDTDPNDTAGQPHWTRLDGNLRPRPHSEREPLVRVTLGVPGETPALEPGTPGAPPRGWVWYTDAQFRMPNGSNRRYWVRLTDERAPTDHGYPGYRNKHGWVRWNKDTWSPRDCRAHPPPTPGAWECTHCGEPQTPGATRIETRINNVASAICARCRGTVIRQCSECHSEVHYRNVHRQLQFRTGPGQYDTQVRDVCMDCWNATLGPQGTRPHNECQVCGFQCTGMPRGQGGVYLCQFCLIANAQCPACHAVTARSRLMRNGTRCAYCADRVIRGHSDRTANNLGPFGVSKVKTRNGRSYDSTIRFGVELEVEVNETYNNEEKAQEALDRIGEDFAIAKSDGSIIHGFELVTAPAPLDVHRERFAKLLGKRLDGLTCQSGRCGMHVHASRAPLTQLQIGKLMVFINDVNNKAFVKAVAGRDSNSFCKILHKNVKDVRSDNRDRYQAINLTNRHTIEFRIFKGTTNLQSVLRNLEFVASSIEWANNASMKQLGWRDYCEYVGRTPSYYPALTKWMRMKGYIKKPKAPPPPSIQPATQE